MQLQKENRPSLSEGDKICTTVILNNNISNSNSNNNNKKKMTIAWPDGSCRR